MSYGVVMCDKCYREVHQDGPDHSWTHCEDKTPKCAEASTVYRDDFTPAVGKFCFRDAMGK